MSARTVTPRSQVLIVGAGPTGLVLALRLSRHGIAVRIVDRSSGPGQASRALVVHARTLEFYRQMGFADDIVGRGIVIEHFRLRRQGGTGFANLALADMGRGLSPYPFVLGYPQDDHERFLLDKLSAAGVTVDWGVELKTVFQDGTGIRATLTRNGTDECCEADYLVGCDGGHSTVRHQLGLDFTGGTYSHVFFVADVETDHAPGNDIVVNLGEGGFLMMMPVRSTGAQRLVGIVPDALSDKSNVAFDDFRAAAEATLRFSIRTVNWFSTYHVHHRVAARFQVGRCFLAGDAGHVHSPAGGQGMNTGIGDAVNLSWKIADVLAGRAAPALLHTYEPERITFARKLIASTDRGFQAIVGTSTVNLLLRTWFIPNFAPLLTRFPAVRRAMFGLISQIRISYRDSPISSGKAGRIRGGDRLPWVPSGGPDNFAPLRSMTWQLHIYGTPDPEFAAASAALNLPVHVFAYDNLTSAAGLRRDGAYLIRPDGYVALALPRQTPAALRDFIAKIGLELKAA